MCNHQKSRVVAGAFVFSARIPQADNQIHRRKSFLNLHAPGSGYTTIEESTNERTAEVKHTGFVPPFYHISLLSTRQNRPKRAQKKRKSKVWAFPALPCFSP